MNEREHALAHLAAVEQGLREMADKVAREIKWATAEGRELFPGRHHALVECGGRVIHEVTWGVANLHLENVMMACFDAAKAEEKAE